MTLLNAFLQNTPPRIFKPRCFICNQNSMLGKRSVSLVKMTQNQLTTMVICWKTACKSLPFRIRTMAFFWIHVIIIAGQMNVGRRLRFRIRHLMKHLRSSSMQVLVPQYRSWIIHVVAVHLHVSGFLKIFKRFLIGVKPVLKKFNLGP